ncbi:MAG: co-chaperone GroES [Candidatus Dadabacteria bacterium]|nr:MAG: co-chaperone GroES [Candidatus Dadabacteria bacterium]
MSPLGMRVLVKIIPQSNVSEGGLYLPEGAKDNMAESLLCEVIEVASAVDDETEEETNISGIPQGAHVLIPRKAGTRIPWDHNLRIVESREILAIVDQIDLV